VLAPETAAAHPDAPDHYVLYRAKAESMLLGLLDDERWETYTDAPYSYEGDVPNVYYDD
jgi:hypothetical protein